MARGFLCSFAADCPEMRIGVDERRLTWEITEGYGIDADSGRLLRRAECAASLRIYRAEPGDRLLLRDGGLEYAVALYDSGPDEKYIYTYEYDPEENWTRYRGNLTEKAWRQTETVFAETVYFRVMLRKRGGQQMRGGLDGSSGLGAESRGRRQPFCSFPSEGVRHGFPFCGGNRKNRRGGIGCGKAGRTLLFPAVGLSLYRGRYVGGYRFLYEPCEQAAWSRGLHSSRGCHGWARTEGNQRGVCTWHSAGF